MAEVFVSMEESLESVNTFSQLLFRPRNENKTALFITLPVNTFFFWDLHFSDFIIPSKSGAILKSSFSISSILVHLFPMCHTCKKVLSSGMIALVQSFKESCQIQPFVCTTHLRPIHLGILMTDDG